MSCHNCSWAELPSNLSQSLLLFSSRSIGCSKYYILLVLFTLVNTSSPSGSHSLHWQPCAAECTGSNLLSVLIFGVYQFLNRSDRIFYHISVSVSQAAATTIPFYIDVTWTPLCICPVILWFGMSAEHLICISNDQR